MSGTITINLVPPVQSISPGSGRSSGPFAGWPLAQLQAALAQAQQALVNAVTGNQPVMVEYSEGHGHRRVSYTHANADQLRVLIRDLREAMGVRTHRSVFPRFG